MTGTRYLKAVASNEVFSFEEYNVFVNKEAKKLWAIMDSSEQENFDNNFEKYLVHLQSQPDDGFVEVDENGNEVELF